MPGDFSLYSCPKLRRRRSAGRPGPSPWSSLRDAPEFADRIFSGGDYGCPDDLPGTTRRTGPPRAPKSGISSRRHRKSDVLCLAWRLVLPTYGISCRIRLALVSKIPDMPGVAASLWQGRPPEENQPSDI